MDKGRIAAAVDGPQLNVLGPVEIVVDGHDVPVAGLRQRAVLALLVLHAGRPVGLDVLRRRLWPVREPATATAVVRNTVHSLRRLLAPYGSVGIDTVGSGYVLRAPDPALDVHRARSLIIEGRARREAGSGAEAVRPLRDAVDLWRGRALVELREVGHEWPEMRELDELRRTALEALVAVELDRGRHRDVVPLLERLVREHAGHEPFHHQRLTALAGAGRPGHAAVAFHDARSALVDRGADVGPQLHRAHRALLEAGPAPATAAAQGGRDTAPEVREVSVLGVRYAEAAGALVDDAATVLGDLTRSSQRRSANTLLAVFGLATPGGTGLDLALEASVALRSRARRDAATEPAIAVLTGHVLVEDPARERISGPDRERGLLRRCEHLVQRTAPGEMRCA